MESESEYLAEHKDLSDTDRMRVEKEIELYQESLDLFRKADSERKLST